MDKFAVIDEQIGRNQTDLEIVLSAYSVYYSSPNLNEVEELQYEKKSAKLMESSLCQPSSDKYEVCAVGLRQYKNESDCLNYFGGPLIRTYNESSDLIGLESDTKLKCHNTENANPYKSYTLIQDYQRSWLKSLIRK